MKQNITEQILNFGGITMARHLRIYMNNPTAGGVDGTEISSENETLPLTLTLDASNAETKAAKVAVRTDDGFLVDGDTDIYFDGTNSAKWQVAADSDYSDADDALSLALWQDTLTIAGVSAVKRQVHLPPKARRTTGRLT